MAGKEVEGGNRGVLWKVGAVLRWTWIVVLSVLVLASLVLRIPWKITVVYSVLLLACTALPRRYRKHFWAGVGLIVLALAGWVFWPEGDSHRWRPYVFEKETEAFLARYRVPNDENAALIYADLSRRWRANDPNEPNVPNDWYDRAREGPWRSEEYPEIAAWLDYHKSTVQLLLQAAGFEQCFFEDRIRDWLTRPGADPPTDPGMRQWAFLLGAAVNRGWAERGLEAVKEKQLALFRYGLHLSSQPEFLFVLTGTAVELLSLAQFNRAMIDGSAGAAYLDRVDREVAGVAADLRLTFQAILDHEKLHMKNSVAAIAYQVNDAGRTRYSRDPFATTRDQAQEMLEAGEIEDEEIRRHLRQLAYPGYWQKKAARASVLLTAIAFPSKPAQMGRQIDQAYAKYASMLDPAFEKRYEPLSNHSMIESADWSRFSWDFAYFLGTMMGMSEGTYHLLHDNFRRAETIHRGTRVIVALCRYRNEHGFWPRDLEGAQTFGKDILWIDGWDRPFVYRPEDDDFVLYSMGKNGIDEGGEYKVEYCEDRLTSTTVADDVMIWPDPKSPNRDNTDDT